MPCKAHALNVNNRLVRNKRNKTRSKNEPRSLFDIVFFFETQTYLGERPIFSAGFVGSSR